MIEADIKPHKRKDTAPSAPADPAIDRSHLARMTLDDRDLEAQVLALFDRQAALLLARMAAAPPAAVAALAHTLNGSARGIGAGRVVAAAARVERAADQAGAADLAEAVEHLGVMVAEARTAILDLLAAR